MDLCPGLLSLVRLIVYVWLVFMAPISDPSDGVCGLFFCGAGEEYSYSADIWALGLTVLTLALGRFPYDDTSGWARPLL